MALKENDGRGARRKLWKRLSFILGSFSILLFGIFLWKEVVVNTSPPPHSRAFINKLRRPAAPVEHHQLASHDAIQEILQAKLHLVDLHVNEADLEFQHSSYRGVFGEFCPLAWHHHKKDPSSTPMFRDLVEKSNCERRHKVDLSEIVQQARQYDDENQQHDTTKVLNLTAVVFHESRCGSTLVANILAGMNPTEHRVYSESQPPLVALKAVCGEDYTHCTASQAARVLQDVMYMMSRSNDMDETRVFFKIQSIGTRNLEVFQKAFPTTPWLFVYREPVQVMMSQLAHGSRMANCVRQQKLAPTVVQEIAQKHHRIDARKLPPEDYCAAHLASITESAVDGLMNDENAIPINYVDLPLRLYEEILPHRLGVTVGPAEIHRIELVASQYSKGRGDNKGAFHEDSEQKEAQASHAIKTAAATFLSESYELLEHAANRQKEELEHLL